MNYDLLSIHESKKDYNIEQYINFAQCAFVYYKGVNNYFLRYKMTKKVVLESFFTSETSGNICKSTFQVILVQ